MRLLLLLLREGKERGGREGVRPLPQEERIKVGAYKCECCGKGGRVDDVLLVCAGAAVGCADMKKPSNGWLRRSVNQMTAGCVASQVTWTLDCVGNEWHGTAFNCSLGTPSYSPVSPRLASNSCTDKRKNAHTHMHPFNGPLSGTTRVSRGPER